MSGDAIRGTRKRRRSAVEADPATAGQPQQAEYEVGYGKPPKHTRFVKGQSGNPRGRPRKPKPRPLRLSDAPSDGFLQEEAYRTVALRENGQAIELPAAQAVLRSLIAQAIKGNRLSAKYILEQVAREEDLHLQRKVQHYNRLERLKREGERTLAEHERRGLPPPDLWPHPDDIVLNPVAGEVYVDGPETLEEAAFFDHSVQLRDHLVLRSAHVSERYWKAANMSEGDTVCAYLLVAQLFDRFLPRRYCWRDGAETSLVMDYLSLTRRERERRIAEEYSQLQAARPRSTLITPEMQWEVDRVCNKLLKG